MSPGTILWRPPEPVLWSSVGGGIQELGRLANRFLADVDGRSWSVVWCAGAGVIDASSESMGVELTALRDTLAALSSAAAGDEGTFFFASSAGGVYAGVGEAPYDESSQVEPLTPYGRAKLDAECLVAEWSQDTGTPALIGRIANLYGPGQNMNKAQGLISQVCRSYLVGNPLVIYVSLDTLRDYLFAPDCASMIVEGLSRLREEAPKASATVVTKILASQRAVTVGAVLGEIRRIFKRRPQIVIGSSPMTAAQPRNLSLQSRVWPDLDRRTLTPFPVGVATTYADLKRRLQDAAL